MHRRYSMVLFVCMWCEDIGWFEWGSFFGVHIVQICVQLHVVYDTFAFTARYCTCNWYRFVKNRKNAFICFGYTHARLWSDPLNVHPVVLYTSPSVRSATIELLFAIATLYLLFQVDIFRKSQLETVKWKVYLATYEFVDACARAFVCLSIVFSSVIRPFVPDTL